MTAVQAGALGDDADKWSSIDFEHARREIRRLQVRIAKAVQENRWNKVSANDGALFLFSNGDISSEIPGEVVFAVSCDIVPHKIGLTAPTRPTDVKTATTISALNSY